jgi:hypothetical protein
MSDYMRKQHHDEKNPQTRKGKNSHTQNNTSAFKTSRKSSEISGIGKQKAFCVLLDTLTDMLEFLLWTMFISMPSLLVHHSLKLLWQGKLHG